MPRQLRRRVWKHSLSRPVSESLVAGKVKNLSAMWEAWVQSLDQEDPLEKEMATHCSILAWRSPWTEEPGGLLSVEPQRVRHDSATKRATCQFRFSFARSPAQRRLSPKRTQTPVPRILCQARKPRRLGHGPPRRPHSPALPPTPNTSARPRLAPPHNEKLSSVRSELVFSGGERGRRHP